MEKQNIRTVTAEQIGELVDFISIDVAFISDVYKRQVLRRIMLAVEYGISLDILFAHQDNHGIQSHQPRKRHKVLQSCLLYTS